MSLDSWAPHRLSHLSDQLVTRNGVWFMGLASLAFLIYSHGDVRLLVVMYSINVFLTFTLSQLGMCRHWWEVRRSESDVDAQALVNGFGLLLTGLILCVTVTTKFAEGGWVTLASLSPSFCSAKSCARTMIEYKARSRVSTTPCSHLRSNRT